MTEAIMPDKKTLKRAQQDKREGKSPSTQAGEFVREEMEHIREGKHGARSAKQAIAIGLSKARRAGVALKAPREGTVSPETRRHAQHDSAVGAKEQKRPRRSARAQRSPRSNAKAAARQARQRFPGKQRRPPKSVPLRISRRRRARQRVPARAADNSLRAVPRSGF
jgi:hypothetical protein